MMIKIVRLIMKKKGVKCEVNFFGGFRHFHLNYIANSDIEMIPVIFLSSISFFSCNSVLFSNEGGFLLFFKKH